MSTCEHTAFDFGSGVPRVRQAGDLLRSRYDFPKVGKFPRMEGSSPPSDTVVWDPSHSVGYSKGC